MRVNRLLSADDTRVFVLTTPELSLNRQIEKYSENEITRARLACMENEALAEFYRNRRPDISCLLPTVYCSFVYVLRAAREAHAAGLRPAGGKFIQL
jgi:hypothetical protein